MEYLTGLEDTGIIFGLDNITSILNAIGNPHERLRFIHVAGTNGKGSVATMLSSILEDAGYRVGKYTSPHLIRFNERIVINKKEIGDADIYEIGCYIKECIERQNIGKRFSYFDFTTAMAFEYFYRMKVDVAVIEVGLGGRLDSTNVINPILCIITNIAKDHMDYLGSNLEDIAKEKAGIIKRGIPVITGAKGVALDVIEKKAMELKCPIFREGHEFSFKKIKEQTIDFSFKGRTYKDLFVSLYGNHQLFNASLAICGAILLKEKGFNISDGALYGGLAKTEWAGRLETVKKRPEIILDGAHNLHAIEAVITFIRDYYKDKNIVLIFGIMADKEYEGILKEIIPLAHKVIFTKANTKRALSPYKLANFAEKCYITDNVFDALKTAKDIAYEDDVILITGSLYIVGEAKKLIDEIF
ncbi:MAG TPA: folylpolyglutamate synthase/dihydrofolate synthase family protein [Syntrophorhabdaceae bacterium]|nr:folylpolyglutamate synthase/dihydrofolate synthase family protein [Syntrophorhabdaceae bacterium]